MAYGLESVSGEESNASHLVASDSTRAASSCGTSARTSSHESALSRTLPLDTVYNSSTLASWQHSRMRPAMRRLILAEAVWPTTATSNLFCRQAAIRVGS